MHSPLESHLRIALRLLRYLKSCRGKGLFFGKSQNLQMLSYVDSDWAKCLATRRSVTGYCIFLGNNLISWKSKKQPTVSRSSTEAEYRALGVVICEIMWIIKLMFDFNITGLTPAKVFCDNKSAILLVSNPLYHERTKHFELDLHFIREKHVAGVVNVQKIDTADNTADIFTKSLSFRQHDGFCNKLGLIDMFHN